MRMAWGLAAASSGAGVGAAGMTDAATDTHASLQWASAMFDAMGTRMTIRAAHQSLSQAEHALALARADVQRIEDQMSLFRSDSLVSRLNRSGVLRQAPAELLQVVRIAQQISARSQGAFDITVQPLWELFDQAQRAGRLPTPAQVQAARARVGWQQLQVEPDSLRFSGAGMGLTLNGIAPGFAADVVKATLQRQGIRHASIDTGEWALIGRAQSGRDWLLGIADPRSADGLITRVAPAGQCLATSADNECHFSEDFVHHHIFDPRTGYSPTSLSCVSVLAPTCVMADALTKVLFAAGFDAALGLARQWHVQALVVRKDGRWQASTGLPLHAV